MKRTRHQYCGEMEEMMGRFPAWIRYTGIMIGCFIILLILGVGVYIKYPVIVEVPVVFVSGNGVDSVFRGQMTVDRQAIKQLSVGSRVDLVIESIPTGHTEMASGIVTAVQRVANSSDYLVSVELLRGGNMAGLSNTYIHVDIVVSRISLFEKLLAEYE